MTTNVSRWRFRLAEEYSFEGARLYGQLNSVIAEINRTVSTLNVLRQNRATRSAEFLDRLEHEAEIQDERLLKLLEDERSIIKLKEELEAEEKLFRQETRI